jgi:N-acetylmuramoyl-L-alanine amidase
MMKKVITGGVVTSFLLMVSLVYANTPDLTGTLIALDAGHGGTAGSGAVNALYGVEEQQVNGDVVAMLKTKLESLGATVVETERVESRRDRVNDAIAKCEADALARKCDILVSVHHNGNADPSHDGTLAIYNEKKDIPLAQAVHDAMVGALGLSDEGYLSGGYGITVYGNLVSAVSEAYYITNGYAGGTSCDPSVYNTDSTNAIDRVDQESNALVDAIVNYFDAAGNGGNGGGPGKGNGKNR